MRRSSSWYLLSPQAHVLLSIARDPTQRIAAIAAAVGISVRATTYIVAQLADGGYIERTRNGRRNRYEVNPEALMRPELQFGRNIRDFLDLMADSRSPAGSSMELIGR